MIHRIATVNPEYFAFSIGDGSLSERQVGAVECLYVTHSSHILLGYCGYRTFDCEASFVYGESHKNL